MKIRLGAFVTIMVLLVVTLGFRFIGGYAFTPRSALGSMPIHGEDTSVFEDLNFG